MHGKLLSLYFEMVYLTPQFLLFILSVQCATHLNKKQHSPK